MPKALLPYSKNLLTFGFVLMMSVTNATLEPLLKASK